MLYKRILLTILVCIFGQTLLAQERSISEDSLKILLGKTYDYYYDYDYKNAIEVSGLILDEASRIDDNYYISLAYCRLGAIHSAINDTAKSRDYYHKSLENALLTKQDTFIAAVYNDLGNVYAEDPVLYQKGIDYYKKNIEINTASNAPEVNNLASTMNIAWTYLDLKQLEKAYPYLLEAQELSKIKEQHPLLYINLNILFGRYYFYTNADSLLTENILKEAAAQAENSNYLEQAAQAHDYLVKFYQREANPEAALESLTKQKEFEDRLHEIQREHELVEASAKFKLEQYQSDLEAAQNEQELSNALIKKTKLLSIIFIIASIIFLIAFIAFFLLFKTRKSYIKTLAHKNKELTIAKNEAEKLSKLKTQFFSTVSHELRTPLYGVIGLSSILLEDKRLKSHKEDLKSLKFSADYLMALINDVLILNKMDANGVVLEQTPFRLKSLIKNISKSFTFSLEQNNNKIHVHIDKEIPKILVGDSIRLSQILMNLVGNAVKFNENGNIWISIDLIEINDAGAYRTKFTIKDDGIGIPEFKQRSIFEEFSQVKNSNYNYQGTGLGLPIVKRLLALHGSTINLESKEGEGATFTFELSLKPGKIVESDDTPLINASDVVFEESLEESLHILVVDDNKINQKITQKILETRNFKCSLADNGEAAVALVRENNYNLVLMDIHMPGIGGIEATKQIRKFNKRIPILALTAVEADEIREEIVASGINDIILKPYDIAQFLSIILRNLNNVYAEL